MESVINHGPSYNLMFAVRSYSHAHVHSPLNTIVYFRTPCRNENITRSNACMEIRLSICSCLNPDMLYAANSTEERRKFRFQ